MLFIRYILKKFTVFCYLITFFLNSNATISYHQELDLNHKSYIEFEKSFPTLACQKNGVLIAPSWVLTDINDKKTKEFIFLNKKYQILKTYLNESKEIQLHQLKNPVKEVDPVEIENVGPDGSKYVCSVEGIDKSDKKIVGNCLCHIVPKYIKTQPFVSNELKSSPAQIQFQVNFDSNEVGLPVFWRKNNAHSFRLLGILNKYLPAIGKGFQDGYGIKLISHEMQNWISDIINQNTPDQKLKCSGELQWANSISKIVAFPYIQPGSTLSPKFDSLTLIWEANESLRPTQYVVKYYELSNKFKFKNERPSKIIKRTVLENQKLLNSFIYKVNLNDLQLDTEYEYEILENNKIIHRSFFRTKTLGNKVDFVVFGDSGFGTPAQKNIANAIENLAASQQIKFPEFVLHTGDLTYLDGKVNEYHKNIFPYYNSPSSLALKQETLISSRLMSKIPFFVALGNHDLEQGKFPFKPIKLRQTFKLDKNYLRSQSNPDYFFNIDKLPENKRAQFVEDQNLYASNDLGCFYYLNFPHNGPITKIRIDSSECGDVFADKVSSLWKPESEKTNYSFDWGNVHFITINGNFIDEDSSLSISKDELNKRQNITCNKIIEWVKNDLQKNKSKWVILTIHQPAFCSLLKGVELYGKKIYTEDVWKSRKFLANLLRNLPNKSKIDLIFTGHIHTYERTLPIKYEIDPKNLDIKIDEQTDIDDFTHIQVDKNFNINNPCKTDWPIHITSGAGGGIMYGARLRNGFNLKKLCYGSYNSHKAYTHFIDAFNPSYSHISIEGNCLHFRQLNIDNVIIDEFKLMKD